MQLLKQLYYEEIKELYEIREKIKKLKVDEKTLTNSVKDYLLTEKKVILKSGNIIASLIEKGNSEITPKNLWSKVKKRDFFDLVKVKISECKKFLSEKDYKEITRETTSYSLKLKEEKC